MRRVATAALRAKIRRRSAGPLRPARTRRRTLMMDRDCARKPCRFGRRSMLRTRSSSPPAASAKLTERRTPGRTPGELHRRMSSSLESPPDEPPAEPERFCAQGASQRNSCTERDGASAAAQAPHRSRRARWRRMNQPCASRGARFGPWGPARAPCEAGEPGVHQQAKLTNASRRTSSPSVLIAPSSEVLLHHAMSVMDELRRMLRGSAGCAEAMFLKRQSAPTARAGAASRLVRHAPRAGASATRCGARLGAQVNAQRSKRRLQASPFCGLLHAQPSFPWLAVVAVVTRHQRHKTSTSLQRTTFAANHTRAAWVSGCGCLMSSLTCRRPWSRCSPPSARSAGCCPPPRMRPPSCPWRSRQSLRSCWCGRRG